MTSTQLLETCGVAYTAADVFRLLESGWNVTYKNGQMSAFRIVLKYETQDGNVDSVQSQEDN